MIRKKSFQFNKTDTIWKSKTDTYN